MSDQPNWPVDPPVGAGPHAASHAAGGEDELTPAAIGAATKAAVEAKLDAAGADPRYKPQVPALVAPIIAEGAMVIATTITVVTNRRYFCRAIVPRTGKLRDISVYIGTSSGNMRAGVYDTGDAAAGKRTRLWESGSVATPAGTSWRIIGDPDLAVTAGQQLELAVGFDNNTATVGRAATPTNGAGVVLPAGFNVVSGGASPKLGGALGSDAFSMPATVEEAGVEGSTSIPCIIGRVS